MTLTFTEDDVIVALEEADDQAQQVADVIQATGDFLRAVISEILGPDAEFTIKIDVEETIEDDDEEEVEEDPAMVLLRDVFGFDEEQLASVFGSYPYNYEEEADVEWATEEPAVSNRRSLLEEAADLVDGDRNAQYGDPIQDFRRTAAFWTEYIQGRVGAMLAVDEDAEFKLEPHDVGAMVALLKLSRIAWSPEKRDSWADLAGYAACGYDCVVREND